MFIPIDCFSFKVRMYEISDINVKLIKLITTIYSGIHFLFGHSV